MKRRGAMSVCMSLRNRPATDYINAKSSSMNFNMVI